MAKKLKDGDLDRLKNVLQYMRFSKSEIYAATSLKERVRVYRNFELRKDCFVTPFRSSPVLVAFSKLPADIDTILLTDVQSFLLNGQNKEIGLVSESVALNRVDTKDSDFVTESSQVAKFEPVALNQVDAKKTFSKVSYTVRLNSLERDNLQKIANDLDIPLAQVLRSAVKFYLANYKG